MSFWGKTAKITSIAMMAAGGAITLTGAVLLGVGCNATYTMTDGNTKVSYGIGPMNLGQINGELPKGSTKPDYWKYYGKSDKYINDLQKEYDALKNAPGSNPMDLKNWEKALDGAKSFKAAGDETIAGAVLLPIFVLILGAGLAIFFINKKKS